MLEITSFVDATRVVCRRSQGIKILPGPVNRGLYPTKTARNGRNQEFCRESCTGGHGASKSAWGRKSWVITNENGQKWPKTRVLPILLELCTGGQGIEILPGRKRPEMAENTSFADPSRVMYRGLQGIEILPGHENHGL